MTQQNKTDNVLVDSRKYALMKKYIECITSVITPEDNLPQLKEKGDEILAMPDFIESERDVEVVARAIFESPSDYDNHTTWEEVSENLDVDGILYSDFISAAQAAINALRYRKEGE